jgi:hypothetical protein
MLQVLHHGYLTRGKPYRFIKEAFVDLSEKRRTRFDRPQTTIRSLLLR